MIKKPPPHTDGEEILVYSQLKDYYILYEMTCGGSRGAIPLAPTKEAKHVRLDTRPEPEERRG